MNSARATLAWSLAGFRGAHDPHNAMEMGERFLPAAAEVPASDPAIAQFGNLRVKRQQIECKKHVCLSKTSKCLRGRELLLLSFSSPMLIPLTALFATLSSVFRSRSVLQLENLALRHQIGVLQRAARKRPKLTPGDRLLWVWLSRIWSDWRSGVGHRQARNGHCLASRRLSPVLDLEGAARPTRPTRRFSRGSRSNPQLRSHKIEADMAIDQA